MIISAIVTSSIPPQQQLDSKRTEYILSVDAVKEVHRQFNKRLENSEPVTLLPSIPKTKDDYLKGIGYNVKCELREPIDYPGCIQCIAEYYIEPGKYKYVDFPNFKKNNALFLLIAYDPKRSVRKIFETEDDSIGITLLEKNFWVYYTYIGEKRSSSNPFLMIL